MVQGQKQDCDAQVELVSFLHAKEDLNVDS